MKNIFGLIFALFFAFSSWQAKAENTSVVFINGITTKEDRARSSIKAVQTRYCITANNDCSTMEFVVALNTTEGFLDDVGELKIQAEIETKAISEANQEVKNLMPEQYKDDPKQYIKGSDAYNLFFAHLNAKLADLIFYERAKGTGIENDENFMGTDKSSANDDIVRNAYKIALNIIGELGKDNSTRRVVLVPHSQGNYFAQAVEALVKSGNPEAAKRLSVMGVASVSTVAQINVQHVSLLQDRALASHAIKTDFETDGNFDAGWSLGSSPDKDDRLQKHPDDGTNHGFLETYLGFKEILLPIDGIQCRNIFVPAERLVQERELRRVQFGKVCQKKEDVINQSLLIGVGNQFPALRGVSLQGYIMTRLKKAVDMVNVAWPVNKWLGFISTLNGNDLPGSESAIEVKDGWATVKSSGYFWSNMHLMLGQPVDGDNVRVEWRSQVSDATGGISCYDHGAYLGRTLDAINNVAGNGISSQMFDGCWWNSGFSVNSTRFTDDSIFIRDLRNPHVYAIETFNGTVNFYIDNVVVKTGTYYPDSVGLLDRVGLYFKGSGLVDYVKVVSDGKQVLFTDF
jgi:hypothetical protein